MPGPELEPQRLTPGALDRSSTPHAAWTRAEEASLQGLDSLDRLPLPTGMLSLSPLLSVRDSLLSLKT
uniref:Uncharacterized protein n=1 Tax=Fagus sylvatica TaxID=28930 RepID=A0A2N9H8E5_FAGSY